MNLLVLVEEGFYPKKGGGALARWRFCNLAAEKGHEVTVLAARLPGTPKREQVEGVNIRRPIKVRPEWVSSDSMFGIFCRMIFSLYIFIYGLLWVSNNKIDGIHSASQATHWVAKLLSIQYDVSVVNFIGYSPSISTDNRSFSTRRFIERLNYRLFMGDAVLCRNENVANLLNEETKDDTNVDIIHGILNERKILNVLNQVNREEIRNEYLKSDDQVMVLFVGRFVPIKQPTEVVRIFEKLPVNHRLIMIGDGPERNAVKEQISKLNLNERVDLTGELAHQDVLKIMAASDLLILTSKTEAYPTVVFESLAFGNHVFAPPVGVLPKLDHNHLHISDPQRMAQEIKKVDLEHGWIADQSTIQEYSMKRYTNTLLEKLKHT